ncbi:right-handed parallel beta-helix repeat-containing protein [Ruania alkalisoli]|uniref:Right-handed parallel beta-helix repeat-containing protein n=1 Tax=Ruania alkalisoli TaxID=2779775 RepID=A0A7M1SU21_9MICO|nr:NosD domain-containing protein [Ruania alkalisoli]QOR71076.1 right-handed parallel beta-helix repeat-containing protein [Ruania alkalisoli]
MTFNVKGALTALVAAVALAATSACAGDSEAQTRPVVHVPADATLDEAGAMVAPGGLILISPGTYEGTLEVSADDVTVRGEDRNDVVLDGGLTASNGIVGTGERITVENLTVRNYLQNGVLITGVTDDSGAGIARGPDGYVPSEAPPPVPGYLVQYVTASNNGLYGIYAFNRTSGVIQHNLASGGSDSGIYVGQCADCNAAVTGNVVVRNAVGIELANASTVSVTGNRIVDNRVGISVLSNYLEAHGPTQSLHVAGNVIADNDQAETPTHASGGFGIGIGLAGAVDADIRSNLIAGHENVGLWITSSEDFAPIGNAIGPGTWADNGLDIAYSPSEHAPGTGNCIESGTEVTTDPDGIAAIACEEPLPTGTYTQPPAPDGISFADVARPDERPGLADIDEQPRQLPEAVELPDVTSIDIPSADLLAAGS